MPDSSGGTAAPGPASGPARRGALAALAARSTVIGAIGRDGPVAGTSIEAATGTAVFQAFVEPAPAPALQQDRPDAIVVMDNPAAHRAEPARRALGQAKIAHRHLPGIMEQTHQASASG